MEECRVEGGVQRWFNSNGESGCILNTQRRAERELGLVYTLTASHFNLPYRWRGFWNGGMAKMKRMKGGEENKRWTIWGGKKKWREVWRRPEVTWMVHRPPQTQLVLLAAVQLRDGASANTSTGLSFNHLLSVLLLHHHHLFLLLPLPFFSLQQLLL